MRSTLLTTSILLLVAAAAGCATPQERIEADYVFENVNILPMNEEVVLANKAVAIRDGKILAIVEQALADSISATKRIDGDGRYLMPGLADMHTHMRMDPQAAFNLYLANGVTTVFNMRLKDRGGDGAIDHLVLRDDVASGGIDGPRYLISGPQLHAEEVPTVADIEPILEDHVEKSYDVVKIHGPLDNDVYDKLISGAHERGLRVTGHLQQLRPLSDSLHVDAIEHMEEFLYVSQDPAYGEAAAGSLENYLKAYLPNAEQLSDPLHRAPIVREVAESGVYVNPTLTIYNTILTYISDDLFAELQSDELMVYLPKKTRDKYLNPETNDYRKDFSRIFVEYLGDQDAVVAHVARNVQTLSALTFEMHEAGVPLLLGTDLFGAVVPGFSLHHELQLIVDAGLTPYQALRTGTVNVAAYLGESGDAGTVEVGKRADFVLVADNPFADIGNTANVSGVFSHGKWRSANHLANLLEEAKAISAGSPMSPPPAHGPE